MNRIHAKIAAYLICCAGLTLAQKTPPAPVLARDFDIRSQPARSAAALRARAAGVVRQQPPRSMSREGRALTSASPDATENIARMFLRSNRQAFRFNDAEVAALRLVRTERAGALRILRFNQTFEGIDVFEGLVRVVIDGEGRVIEAGADAVVCISASPNTSRDFFERIVPARAIENTAYSVYVNNTGCQLNQVFFGGSHAVGPRGNQLVKCDYFRKDVRGVDLDLSEVRAARRMRPTVRDSMGLVSQDLF